MMAVSLGQLCDEGLRLLYALISIEWSDVILDAALGGLVAAFGLATWRLRHLPNRLLRPAGVAFPPLDRNDPTVR